MHVTPCGGRGGAHMSFLQDLMCDTPSQRLARQPHRGSLHLPHLPP